MACADVDMVVYEDDDALSRPGQSMQPLIQYYQATEVIPDEEGPLHKLLQKQPAVLGCLQIVSGLFSFGLGILFAATQDMKQSLFTLFRISHLTGVLFIVAGFLSNLLSKYPALLSVSRNINCGCIIVAAFATCLISIDLARWNPENDLHLRVRPCPAYKHDTLLL
ncbi:hypothetical protein PAMA_015070 [Pampus argenteus]